MENINGKYFMIQLCYSSCQQILVKALQPRSQGGKEEKAWDQGWGPASRSSAEGDCLYTA